MNKETLTRVLALVQARESAISFRNFYSSQGPADKLNFTAQDNGEVDFFLYNVIGGYDGISSAEVAQAVAGLSGNINLHINSAGGSIFEGFAIYNTFKNYSRGKVRSYIDGVAASAASFIALGAAPYDATANTGGVVMEKTASLMVHDGSGGVIGTPKDMREQAEVLDKLSDTIAAVYANKAGGTPKTWRKTMQTGDTWYTAEEAFKANLVDVVAGTTGATNSFDMGIFTGLLDTDPVTTPDDANPENDFEGFRNSLIGAFK